MKANLVAPLFLCALLAACSGQEAFKDGMTLMDEGKPEESMAKFSEALKQSPKDVEYRSAYLKAQEKALTIAVEQADRLTAKGAFDEARALYRHALALDPDYGRALDGLTELDSRVRRKALLDEAETQLARGQIDAASQKLARLQTEAPSDPRVQALIRALENKRADESPDARLAQTYKKPITIEFKDVSLKQVFEVISHTSELNFLFDKDVKTDQHTSIFLKNSNIESAVRFLLLTNQLEQQVMDANTVLIYPNTPAKQKDYQELDVRTFYLANGDAKTIANTLKTILKMQNIVADEKLNMVVVRDTPDAIRMAEKLVAVEDVADPEVMLDVEVLEVSRSFTQNLGIQWPGSLTVLPTPLGTAVGTGGGTGSNNSSGSSAYNGSSSNSSPTGSTSLLSLHDLAHQTTRSLGVTVGGATANANQQDSGAKILTNPRIRVRNHEKAKILIGNREPNITSTATSTGFLSQSVNYIDVGLTLNVEPTIYLDDYVGLKLQLEVSSITNTITTQTGTSAYEIGTRDASTVLRLKNGETDVLAGLIDTQERTSGNKIPGFGSLPLLGRLFGASTDDDTSTEIVLAITPHLVRNIERPDAANALFKSGTENSLHSSGGSGGGVSISAPPSAPTAPTSAPSSPSSNYNANSGQNGLMSENGLSSGSGGVIPSAGTGADTTPVTDTTAGGVPASGIAVAQLQGNSPVAVGGTVSVNVLLQSTAGVTGLSTQLSFDPSRLQVTNIVEGPFMRQSGSATNFSSRVSNGTVTLADSTASGAGATAQGIFATVTFQALAPASATSVQLVSSQALGVGNVPITLEPPAPFTLQISGS